MWTARSCCFFKTKLVVLVWSWVYVYVQYSVGQCSLFFIFYNRGNALIKAPLSPPTLLSSLRDSATRLSEIFSFIRIDSFWQICRYSHCYNMKENWLLCVFPLLNFCENFPKNDPERTQCPVFPNVDATGTNLTRYAFDFEMKIKYRI